MIIELKKQDGLSPNDFAFNHIFVLPAAGVGDVRLRGRRVRRIRSGLVARAAKLPIPKQRPDLNCGRLKRRVKPYPMGLTSVVNSDACFSQAKISPGPEFL